MLDEGLPKPTSTISSILNISDVGAHVAEAVFAHGMRSAEKLIMTSVEMWQSTVRNVVSLLDSDRIEREIADHLPLECRASGISHRRDSSSGLEVACSWL